MPAVDPRDGTPTGQPCPRCRTKMLFRVPVAVAPRRATSLPRHPLVCPDRVHCRYTEGEPGD